MEDPEPDDIGADDANCDGATYFVCEYLASYFSRAGSLAPSPTPRGDATLGMVHWPILVTAAAPASACWTITVM